MTPEQRAWVFQTAAQAYTAEHVYPKMAACEAALESGYGTSQLAKSANNLFGTKQHLHPVFGTVTLPTHEYLDGEWVIQSASWVSYPNVPACFKDRMDTLLRLRTAYSDYNEALMAETPEAYVIAVSRRWSTSPSRASDCIGIYHEVFPPPVSNAEQVQDAATGAN